MRLAHKRKVQSKLQKRVKAVIKNLNNVAEKPVKKVVKDVVIEAPVVAVAAPEIALTEKQQAVYDIVAQNADGINSKSIGLAAGQEEGKAASWATGGLKKLIEANLVEKVQLDGNKVIYKLK